MKKFWKRLNEILDKMSDVKKSRAFWRQFGGL